MTSKLLQNDVCKTLQSKNNKIKSLATGCKLGLMDNFINQNWWERNKGIILTL